MFRALKVRGENLRAPPARGHSLKSFPDVSRLATFGSPLRGEKSGVKPPHSKKNRWHVG
jgi:hypothetical protein